MTSITRRFKWDAGHRVLGHGGKCRHLHGHEYHAEVTVTAGRLDGLGMVLDFSAVKEAVGKWIDDNWDHNFLCHPDDPLNYQAEGRQLSGPDADLAYWRKEDGVFAGRKPYVMKIGNPTAENIARELFDKAQELLGDRFRVVKVRVQETQNCVAEYEPDGTGPAAPTAQLPPGSDYYAPDGGG